MSPPREVPEEQVGYVHVSDNMTVNSQVTISYSTQCTLCKKWEPVDEIRLWTKPGLCAECKSHMATQDLIDSILGAA